MTVRPARAAGLVLLRHAAPGTSDTIEVLLGRRHRRSRFMPNVYVFPGGRVDAEDDLPSGFAEDLPAAPGALELTPPEYVTCARTAVREMFEETGLLIGLPDSPPAPAKPATGGIWATFAEAGLAPAFMAMRLVARAVTPADCPIRFDTYFFAADGTVAWGDLTGNGELEDIGWVPAGAALSLPMAEVTRLILEEALSLQTDSHDARDLPVFSV
ncbi:MAG TPA: hypothetical protein VGA60_06890 [Kiloniellales bacterium]